MPFTVVWDPSALDELDRAINGTRETTHTG